MSWTVIFVHPIHLIYTPSEFSKRLNKERGDMKKEKRCRLGGKYKYRSCKTRVLVFFSKNN
jgi:mRNA-degrading endonuclease RelE of RelBE toxin-antitoxin system